MRVGGPGSVRRGNSLACATIRRNLIVLKAKLLDGTYEAAPDLFCLDLYKEFDVDRLAALAWLAGLARLTWRSSPPERHRFSTMGPCPSAHSS